MSTLTAIESAFGWHISIMVLIWSVFLLRFNQTARAFFDLRYDDGWESQVLRWGIIVGFDLVIPATLAAPAFYCTGFVRPVGWIIRGSTWMVLLRLGSKSRCCCDVGRHRRHWRKPDSPNRRRHSNPEDDTPREVI